jgi:hypothetical protein
MNSFSPIPPFNNQLENKSFSSIPNESDSCESSIISNSNDRCFSIKDIFPDTHMTLKRPKAQKKSSQIEILTPQALFSHTRKNSVQSIKEKKILINCESEELNSTRMPTCHSRRISEYDLRMAKVIPEPKSTQLDDPREELYCKNCLKKVTVSSKFPDNFKFESILLEFANYFCACWKPDGLDDLKVKICNTCGSVI